jgi:tetratricopeptide (TPR) repeat protein
MVSLLQYGRRFKEAETLALSLRDRAPNQPAVHTQLGRIYAATGRFDEAIAEFQKLVDSAAGDAYTQAELACAHAAAGRVDEAQLIRDRLAERARTEDVDPELFALIAVRLHRYDDAFMYLQRAVQEKSRRVLWMKVDPRLDPIRNDPRFDVLVNTLGI